MTGAQVEISSATLETLRHLSTEFGESIQTIVEKAVEQYQRKKFLEGLNQDFKALKEDPQAWQEELEERAADDSWLDVEYMTACGKEADPSITLESVWQILAKIPGSLAEDIIAERDERF